LAPRLSLIVNPSLFDDIVVDSVPSTLLNNKSFRPIISILPLTDNFSVGEVVPIPTFPEESILILSVLFVNNLAKPFACKIKLPF
jgi:hypothetical protein